MELNFQVPGRNFSVDHLFLVVPPIEYHKEIPVIVGTYVLDRFIEYQKDIGVHVLPILDPSWQITYYARVDEMRLREAHEKEAPHKQVCKEHNNNIYFDIYSSVNATQVF